MPVMDEKRFHELLHAYELGILLSDEEIREIEIYLLENEWAMAELASFQGVIKNLRFNPEIIKSLGQWAKMEKMAHVTAHQEKNWYRRFAPGIIPLFLAIAALLILILKPWDIQFLPSKEATADENRLAIMTFENLSEPDDPENLCRIITNLLIADLVESSQIQVISEERIKTAMEQKQPERGGKPYSEFSQEIAHLVRARWLLTGNLVESDSGLIVSTRLLDARSGDILYGRRIIAGANESPFALVDRLGVAARQDLANLTKVAVEPDLPLGEITTQSSEAFKFYLRGLDNYHKFLWQDAVADFKTALTYDSTFAMAYYYLSLLNDEQLLKKAVAFIDRAGQIGRYFISARDLIHHGHSDSARIVLNNLIRKYPDEKYAYLVLGNLEINTDHYARAIQILEAVIAMDPEYKSAYNLLTYAYDKADNLEKALWAINKYIELAPNEPNPYDTKGDLYAGNGKPQEALACYKRAVEIYPDFTFSSEKAGHIFLLLGEYDAADSCYKTLTQSPDTLAARNARLYQALIPFNQGRYVDALKMIDKILLENDRRSLKGFESRAYFLRANVRQGQGDYRGALSDYEKGVAANLREFPEMTLPYDDLFPQLLAFSGDFVKAETVAEETKDILENSDLALHRFWYARAVIAYASEDYTACIKHLQTLIYLDAPCDCFHVHYLLGQAMLKSGDYGGAVGEFEKLTQNFKYLRVYHGHWNLRLPYYLGIAYEESRWYEKAIGQYELFLESTMHADSGIPEIEDAKSRLARLKSKP